MVLLVCRKSVPICRECIRKGSGVTDNQVGDLLQTVQGKKIICDFPIYLKLYQSKELKK